MNISIVKTLVGINLSDNSLDMLLDYLLRLTENKVKNYCNIKEIPQELELTVAEMAANLYLIQYKSIYDLKAQEEKEQQEQNNPSPEPKTISNVPRQIKKETIGDYSVEYESLPTTKTSVQAPKSGTIDDVLNDFKGQLKRFRKIKL